MPYGLPGLYIGSQEVILLKDTLTYIQSVEVLSEEIGHHFTSAGDITNYKDIKSIKQELKARRFGYELILSLDNIIRAWKAGIHNLYGMADFFEVSQEFVLKAIDHYKMKFGLSTFHGDYLIRFEPLQVYQYNNLEI